MTNGESSFDGRPPVLQTFASSTTTSGAIMLPKHRIPTHPGQVLLEEFLNPMGISQAMLAEHLGVPIQRVNELVKGKRGVTTETAWLLAGAFKTTPELWMNLQTQHDLARNRPSKVIEVIEASNRSTREGKRQQTADKPRSSGGARSNRSRASRSSDLKAA
jgi:antitoxin HigA-1